jgi:hypothetical protein
MGTQRKFYENNKNSTMPPSLERKKKLGSLWVHVTSLHWLQEFFLPTCIFLRVMNYEGKFIPFFFPPSPFAMSHFDWPITKKLHKTLEVPQNRGL